VHLACPSGSCIRQQCAMNKHAVRPGHNHNHYNQAVPSQTGLYKVFGVAGQVVGYRGRLLARVDVVRHALGHLNHGYAQAEYVVFPVIEVVSVSWRPCERR
jgi:hypothetical protein